ncbi:BA75_04446T0 [Komagataella pastoris]|uniref:BA75_04446T0 n=1 Tax=Komagataella pastoris TaxID=4922 RepID=A0A1B2JHB8_PICPA|nr:BA75_04446T0 [Komagataella pastoris]
MPIPDINYNSLLLREHQLYSSLRQHAKIPLESPRLGFKPSHIYGLGSFNYELIENEGQHLNCSEMHKLSQSLLVAFIFMAVLGTTILLGVKIFKVGALKGYKRVQHQSQTVRSINSWVNENSNRFNLPNEVVPSLSHTPSTVADSSPNRSPALSPIMIPQVNQVRKHSDLYLYDFAAQRV